MLAPAAVRRGAPVGQAAAAAAAAAAAVVVHIAQNLVAHDHAHPVVASVRWPWNHRQGAEVARLLLPALESARMPCSACVRADILPGPTADLVA